MSPAAAVGGLLYAFLPYHQERYHYHYFLAAYWWVPVSLVPAFILSELKVSFLMGFRVYLPFLVIDMVIASLLISMSMMMLPPVLISLPFKLLLFVLVDGWQLVVGSLMTSFVTHPALPGAAAAGAAAVGAAAGGSGG